VAVIAATASQPTLRNVVARLRRRMLVSIDLPSPISAAVIPRMTPMRLEPRREDVRNRTRFALDSLRNAWLPVQYLGCTTMVSGPHSTAPSLDMSVRTVTKPVLGARNDRTSDPGGSTTSVRVCRLDRARGRAQRCAPGRAVLHSTSNPSAIASRDTLRATRRRSTTGSTPRPSPSAARSR
jgi:hypothetical protein